MSDVRLAELLAALSLAGDLGHGRVLEHSLRGTYLACLLADAVELDEAERRDVFYVGLLQAVGCVGNAHEIASEHAMDEIAFKRDIAVANFLGPPDQLRAVARHMGSAGPAALRPLAIARALGAPSARHGHTLAHCETGALIARRAGLGDGTRAGLFAAFERWDGQGSPASLRGAQIPVVARLVAVAVAADLFRSTFGVGAVRARLGRAGGAALDPGLVASFGELLDRRSPWSALDAPTLWQDVLALEPAPKLVVGNDRLDELAHAFADFADLKSPWFVGHSRAVATIAATAARTAQLGEHEVALVERAALLHDVGRASVPNTVLDKPQALTPGERERVRLHPYYTERVLERAPAFSACAAIAGAHHERIDGSGYHRGTSGSALPIAARILGAADAFQALSEARPYRAARAPDQAAAVLRQEVTSGRLNGDVVEQVIAAATGAQARRVRAPSTLSDRELEVVRLLAAGESNKGIARRLDISENTTRHHLESVYSKLEVRTRTGAVMQALARGLL